jgi:multisubunit Na+/H+ antiporter MnhE subunit
LLLRGCLIPAAMAWLGVIASALLAVLLLLRTASLFGPGANWSSSLTWLTWLPMLVFELTFAAWLIVKGVDAPERRHTV